MIDYRFDEMAAFFGWPYVVIVFGVLSVCIVLWVWALVEVIRIWRSW